MVNVSMGWATTSKMAPVRNAERTTMLRLKKLLATSSAASRCLGLSSNKTICLSLRDVEFLRTVFSGVLIENKAVSEQDTMADRMIKTKINKPASISATCKAITFKKIWFSKIAAFNLVNSYK